MCLEKLGTISSAFRPEEGTARKDEYYSARALFIRDTWHGRRMMQGRETVEEKLTNERLTVRKNHSSQCHFCFNYRKIGRVVAMRWISWKIGWIFQCFCFVISVSEGSWQLSMAQKIFIYTNGGGSKTAKNPSTVYMDSPFWNLLIYIMAFQALLDF